MKSRVLSIYFLLYIFTPFSPCVLASFLPSIFPCVSSPFSFFSIIYSYPFLFSFSVLTFHVAFLLPFFFLLFFSLRYPLSFYYFIYISTFLSFPFYCHARFPRLFGINCSGICFVFFYLFLYLYLSSFQFLYILYFFHFYFLPLSILTLHFSLIPTPFKSFSSIYSFHTFILLLSTATSLWFLYIFFPFSLFVPLYILSIFSLLLLSILTLTSHVVLTAQRPLSWSLLPSVPRCCWGPGGVVGSQGQLAQKWPLASSGAWGTRYFVGRVRSQRSQGLPRVCLAGLEASLWAAAGSFVFVLLILCA